MIYKVSFSEDLVDSLARRLINEYATNPFQLAHIHIILPTKRACLVMKNAFMRLLPKQGLLLPKLTSLYELDILDDSVPPALSPLERIVFLSKLCLAKPHTVTYDQAIKMAISLAELLDLSYQYDLDLSSIKHLVQTEKFASHWQQTVEFLDILHTYWPQILREQEKIDPMDRSIRLIRSFTEKIKKDNSTPIILAGFTDIFPAVTELIETVSQNKKNLILMESCIAQDDSIPYYTNTHTPQESIALEAFAKETWEPTCLPKTIFQNVSLIHSETITEEALSIALILRQVLETPEQTGALVTTDRTLARQVISQMKRWGIHLNDSAGIPLNHTTEGTFFELIATLGIAPTPTNYLALLKHPLAADKKMPAQLHQLVRTQEKLAREDKHPFSIDLNVDFNPWLKLFQNNVLLPFSQILTHHIELAEQLATSSDKSAPERLWQTQYGQSLFKLLTQLLDIAPQIGYIETKTYPEILKLFMQQVTVRPKYGTHPRLDILGPIEARFHHADVCIIGGLNEGTFPPIPETGPWINRPMRATLGVPAPEDKIQQLETDFIHNFCSPKVYLTRAQKVDGAQTVPSRFISRLKAVAQINHLVFPEYQAHLTKLLDTPLKYDFSRRPTPCPPSNARPNRLPVTQIEMWRRNPYAIYARYILKLKTLPTLNDANKNAEFGSLIHTVLQTFFTENPHSIDKQKLQQTADKIFDQSSLSIVDKMLLRIKFNSMIDFVIDQQKKDMSHLQNSLFEQHLEHTFDIQNIPFTLHGTADRIDTLNDNSARIIDYKTYQPPTAKEVKAGYAPQLTLEALLLSETTQQNVSTLAYWYLSDKSENSKNYTLVESETELKELIQKAKQGLYQMVITYRNEKVPYEVCPIPSQAPQYNDYAHLARMQEWADETGDEA